MEPIDVTEYSAIDVGKTVVVVVEFVVSATAASLVAANRINVRVSFISLLQDDDMSGDTQTKSIGR